MMLEELQRLNYAQNTTRSYIRTVEEFARPLQLPTGSPGPAAYSRIPSDAVSQTEVVTGKRRCPSGCLEVLLLQDTQAGLEHHRHSYPKKDHRLPQILSKQEVERLINAASTTFHRTLLMTLYATAPGTPR